MDEQIRDYLNRADLGDYSAVRRLLMEIEDRGLATQYVDELADVLYPRSLYSTWNKQSVWEMLLATPMQHAQAFRRTVAAAEAVA